MIVSPHDGRVIAFPSRSQDDPHVTGPARCIGCRHQWQAVVAFEKRLEPLECPNCHCMKGLLVMPYVQEAGVDVWRCECGNDLVYILRDGTLCPNCGNRSRVQ